jgi:hypothetical protein
MRVMWIEVNTTRKEEKGRKRSLLKKLRKKLLSCGPGTWPEPV